MGVFAGMDTVFPLAFKQLVQLFQQLGNRQLMSRCNTLRTQNANELLHSKIFGIINKTKYLGSMLFNVGCQLVLLAQNFGILNSSMMSCFGTMSDDAKHGLFLLDNEATRVSKRVWEGKSGIGTSHRTKLHSRPYAAAAVAAAAKPTADGSNISKGHPNPTIFTSYRLNKVFPPW